MRSLVIFLFALSVLFPAMGANNPQEEPQKYEIEYSYEEGYHIYKLNSLYSAILRNGKSENIYWTMTLTINTKEQICVLLMDIFGNDERIVNLSNNVSNDFSNGTRIDFSMVLEGLYITRKKTFSGNGMAFDARKPEFRGTNIGLFKIGVEISDLKLLNVRNSYRNNQEKKKLTFAELLKLDVASFTIGDLTFDMGDDICTSEIFKQINKDLKTKAPWLYNERIAMESSSSSSKASKKTTPRPITKVPGANTASASNPYSFSYIGETEELGRDYEMPFWEPINCSGRTIKARIGRCVDEDGRGSVSLYFLADNPDLAKIYEKAKKYKLENGESIHDDITITLSNNSVIKTKSFILSLFALSWKEELGFIFPNESSMQTYDIIQIEYDGIVIPLLGFRSAATLKAMTDDAQRRHSSKREFKPEYTGQD